MRGIRFKPNPNSGSLINVHFRDLAFMTGINKKIKFRVGKRSWKLLFRCITGKVWSI